MKNKKKIKIIVLIVVVTVFLAVLVTPLLILHWFYQIPYNEDIHVPLQSREGEIIIREARFLFSTKATIYYKKGWWSKKVWLGTILMGDRASLPFEKGLYCHQKKKEFIKSSPRHPVDQSHTGMVIDTSNSDDISLFILNILENRAPQYSTALQPDSLYYGGEL